MARKPLVQARVGRDTKESIDNFTDDLDADTSQSEAVRMLLRTGLAEHGHPVAVGGDEPSRYINDSILERLAAPFTVALGTILLILSTGLIGTAGFYANTNLFVAMFALGAGTVTMVIAAIIIWTAALAQLALARPLKALFLPMYRRETT